MKIPLWVKHIAKCVDPESVRFVLGCVQVVVTKGWAYLSASDGRLLVTVTYPTKSPDLVAVLDGKEFGKAVQSCATKDVPARLVMDGDLSSGQFAPIATISSDKGASTIKSNTEGRFPDCERIFGEMYTSRKSKYRRVSVDPKLLGKLCEVFSAAVTYDHKAVDVFFSDAQSAIFFCHRRASGEIIRAALMPVEHDSAEFLGPQDSEKAEEPVAAEMKPVVGTKPSASGKKSEFVPTPMAPESISGVPGQGKASSWVSLVESEAE